VSGPFLPLTQSDILSWNLESSYTSASIYRAAAAAADVNSSASSSSSVRAVCLLGVIDIIVVPVPSSRKSCATMLASSPPLLTLNWFNFGSRRRPGVLRWTEIRTGAVASGSTLQWSTIWATSTMHRVVPLTTAGKQVSHRFQRRTQCNSSCPGIREQRTHVIDWISNVAVLSSDWKLKLNYLILVNQNLIINICNSYNFSHRQKTHPNLYDVLKVLDCLDAP